MTVPLVVVLSRDAGLLWALQRLLGRWGFGVRGGSGHPDELVAAAHREDVVGVLVDARLLGAPAVTDLPSLGAAFPSAPVLVMAARREHPVLGPALQQGALALTADFDPQVLLDTLRRGDGLAGVREPRRPRQPSGSAGLALDLPGASGG